MTQLIAKLMSLLKVRGRLTNIEIDEVVKKADQYYLEVISFF